MTPSGNMHFKGVQAVVKLESVESLVDGELTWEGAINVDKEGNMVGGGTGRLVTTRGEWRTKWEVTKGVFGGSYTGKVVGHGLTGDVAGMQFEFEMSVDSGVEHWVGQILDPHAKK